MITESGLSFLGHWPLSSSNLIQLETHFGVEKLLHFLSFFILLKPQDNKRKENGESGGEKGEREEKRGRESPLAFIRTENSVHTGDSNSLIDV